MLGFAYDASIDKCRQEEVAAACAVVDTIDRDWVLFFGATAITWTGLGTNYEAWRQGLLVAIEEE